MGRISDPLPPESASLSKVGSDLDQKVSKDGKDTYKLTWKDFPSNLLTFFKELREAEEFVDVTLACEGHQVSAHKVVLSAASPFFRNLLKTNPCDHPIIILNDVRYAELQPLLDYMYNGDVHIEHKHITDFLRTAKILQIRGLAGESAETPPPSEEPPPDTPLRPTTPLSEHDPGPPSPTHSSKRPRLGDAPYGPSASPPPPPPLNRTSMSPSLPVPGPLPGVPGGMLPLHPLSGLPMPLSIPSSITALPPVTSALSAARVLHTPTPPAATPTSTFSHLFPPHGPPLPPPSVHINNEDTNDETSSSDEKHSKTDDDADGENSLDKMSGLANISALKGLAGFPGPSGLVGLASAALGSTPDSSSG